MVGLLKKEKREKVHPQREEDGRRADDVLEYCCQVEGIGQSWCEELEDGVCGRADQDLGRVW